MLRAGSLLLISLLSFIAWGANFDFVPSGGGPEKEFQTLISAGKYGPALKAWTPAHSGSAFGRSADGVATYAYLLYQNGMQFTAVELLTQTTQPNKINPSLLAIWTQELKSSVYVQKGWIPMSGGWKQIVNNEVVHLSIKKDKDAKAALTKADKLPKEQVNAKARLWWQVATLAPLIGDLDDSLKALKLLKESGQTVIGQDMVVSAYARVLYQKGDMDAALVFFKQIPKSSSLWVEAVEERAWTELRKSDYDKALGEVTTLMSPVLDPLVGPESYFLSNLMSLKVCDYNRLFKTSELFKARHRQRLVEMQTLANTGSNTGLNAVLGRFEQSGVSIESAGPMVASIPRQSYRDAQFVRYMESRRELLAEAKKATELADSASDLNRFVQAARGQAEAFKKLAIQRERTLAKREVNEYHILLNKMHILEAEVIERIHLDQNLKGQRSKLSKTEDSGDVLVFPIDSTEAWLDELDNYKARVKDCPTLKGASL